MRNEGFGSLSERAIEGESGGSVAVYGWLDRIARSRVQAALGALEEGELALTDASGTTVFRGPRDGPRGAVVVLDVRAYRALAFGGVLGGAEAYMNGWWRSEDLLGVIRVFARNAGFFGAVDEGSGWKRPWLRLIHALRDNDRAGSRRNIHDHYDLGNEFFASFLDPSLTYSSAVFEREAMPLEAAQTAKYERLCRKLELNAGHHVLEIGTGWGGFALHAARTRGCRVTTTTISREQHALARERIERAGLGDRVEILLEDYRDLHGTYDRLVSIEMIEAVGHRHLARFFEVCANRLASDGAMALQAILVPEQWWEHSKQSVDFIKRYIFPGGQLVALGAISQALAGTALRMVHYEDITPHYAETLHRWRARFLEQRATIATLGMDERFFRTWDYYLAYCEGAFHERINLAAQIVFENSGLRRGAILGALG
ncbi:cyclopropane-fatty-acyl-phospholipid synthase family protein [Myxococcota bacterium]|nr:cyclopropane-fatty-acyl-phospholipid synthase family protein [Myxococcota bacterium]